MVRANSYRELKVWQKAIDLVKAVYAITQRYPDTERFGLTSQTQRAAVSIPANIAERSGRHGSAEMAHHLSIALGSAAELDTLLELAHQLRYLDCPDYGSLVTQLTEIQKMANATKTKLRTNH